MRADNLCKHYNLNTDIVKEELVQLKKKILIDKKEYSCFQFAAIDKLEKQRKKRKMKTICRILIVEKKVKRQEMKKQRERKERAKLDILKGFWNFLHYQLNYGRLIIWLFYLEYLYQ